MPAATEMPLERRRRKKGRRMVVLAGRAVREIHMLLSS